MNKISDSIEVFQFDNKEHIFSKFIEVTNTSHIFEIKKSNTYRSIIKFSEHNNPNALDLIDSINFIINRIIKGYCESHMVEVLSWHETLTLAKYVKDDYFPKHIDGEEIDNMLVIIIYLNDDYEGGVLQFDKLNLSHIPKSGEALVMPAHTEHSLSKITDGVRYTIMARVKIK